MRHLHLALLLSASLALPACGDSGGGDDDQPAACNPELEACAHEHDFGVTMLAPGEELDGWCSVWDIRNATELWVTNVEVTNDGAYHHSNWFFVPNNNYDVPDGNLDCNDINFDELSAAIAGGVLFAQSTQSTIETQTFPQGAAVRIPPYSRLVASTHLLNTGESPVTTGLRVHIDTVPAAQVAHKLAPFRFTYHDLTIPPMSKSTFELECDLKTAEIDALGVPFSLDLYYVLPHAHILADDFQLELYGGPRDGEVIYHHPGYNGETWGKTFESPLVLDMAADSPIGFRFSCGFDNPRQAEVGWGIGDQEMCVMLGFAESEMAFEAYVDDGDGMSLGVVDGRERFTGPCTILAVPFFQDKGGGNP